MQGRNFPVLLLATLLGVCFGPVCASVASPARVLRIGALAHRSEQQCRAQWEPTAAYLTAHLPGYDFEIAPLDFDAVLPAVHDMEIDFLVADPAFLVMAEEQFFLQRLATMRSRRPSGASANFAGALVVREDCRDIHEIVDLRDHSVGAVHPFSLGGWLAQRLMLVEAGLDPERDLGSLRFFGSHDAVVRAVLAGQVDAGFIRSGILEQMDGEGLIEHGDLDVLAAHQIRDCRVPFAHTTADYPEWPFARLQHVDGELAREVGLALLAMTDEEPAARAAGCASWSLPLSYAGVRENLQRQGVGPWSTPRQAASPEIPNHSFWPQGIILLTLSCLLAFAFLMAVRSRSRLQEAMNRLQEDESRLVESEKMASVGQVAAGVAHEINNPVGFIMSNLFTLQEYFDFQNRLTSAVQVYARSLEEDRETLENDRARVAHLLEEDDPEFIREDGFKLINESLDGATRVKEIVLNLMNMAKVDGGESPDYDLNEGITAVRGVIETRPHYKGRIGTDLQPLVPVCGRPAELNQALLNLLENALEHTPAGTPISVTSQMAEDRVCIRIADEGPGIPAGFRERIFNPFFTTKRAGQGAGLGLSLARDIINRHHGSLTLDEREGPGACFRITLPSNAGEPKKPAPPAEEPVFLIQS